MVGKLRGSLAAVALALFTASAASGQEFEITGVTFDGLIGNITELTISDNIVPSTSFVDGTLTDFTDSDTALGYNFPFAGFPAQASTVIEGFNVYNGLVNPDSWQITFDTPVVNTVGPDAIIFDVGRPGDADGFTVTAGGPTLDFSGSNRPTPFGGAEIPFELYGSSNTGLTSGVAALDAESFSLLSSGATSQRNFFLIEFDRLGIPRGSSVTTLDFVGFDGFDPSGIIGLPELIEPEVPVPGLIQAVDIGEGGVLNSITIRGTTIPQTSMTNVSLTAFADPNEVLLLTTADVAPPVPPSDVLADTSVDTGLANYGEITVTFDAPVENTGDVDVVIVDVGGSSDPFDLTINGITVTIPPGSQDFATDGQIPFDIQTSNQGGPFNSVTQLDAATFTTTSTTSTSQRNFIAVDLDDFGVADGATITSLTIENPVDGGFDTMAVFGLPEFTPTILPGDYNGDGSVDAADFTFYRNNLGKSENLLAFGSRDPNNTGEINTADLAFWASQYGNVSAALMGSAVSVPEPGAAALLTLGLLAIGRRRVG